jgi:hypothetical protein
MKRVDALESPMWTVLPNAYIELMQLVAGRVTKAGTG